MATLRRKDTREMKLNALHLVQDEGRSLCDVADELGINRNTLYAWLHDVRNGKFKEPVREITPVQAGDCSATRRTCSFSSRVCAPKKIRSVPRQGRPQMRYAFM